MRLIQSIATITGKILEGLVIFLLVLMTGLMFAQFLGRFVFKNGIFWAEELSRFTMVTMVYLGAGLACKGKDHIRITILDGYLKGTAHKILNLIIALLSIGFLAVIARYGYSVLSIVSRQKSANMQMTMNWIYMMLPISSCIMIFYIIVDVLEMFLVKKGDGAIKAQAAAGGNEK